ncbi:hypothetical protein F0Q45_12775 [Mycobacterium simiae]|uniref:WXG100 family type VII secretion target n=1 Tax=Mycobacterium simiae TaxID=1784 RepID=A0A5B1BR94_MYCSI|nr:hypothetical protein [Mycobacterium simiae]KAA1249873.1 hypothetical protein F0Q45_12775 [Mycobacterium simiae]
MSSGMPFNMDMAVQAAQTASFQGLVDSATANNKQLLIVADSALAANRGQMSDAFQTWLSDVQQTAVSNNQVLDQIREALHFGIGATDAQEASAAGDFQAITGVVNPFH